MRKKMKPSATPALSRLLVSLSLILFLSAVATAQTVSGTVTDGADKPVAGVTVAVKGTNRATVTNDAGNFSINAAGTDVLVLSAVGFSRLEIPINRRSDLRINMAGGLEQNLDEIVVTALGRKQAARNLGYSATTAKIDEMQQNRTNNLMTSLEGKIAGLDISPPSAGPASSNKIRIRGQSGFPGSNGPLIVINGLPMDQGAASAAGGGGANADSRDRGDNLLLVNPDDIESMTVLKGATAAALYGGRASNGAIIITTK